MKRDSRWVGLAVLSAAIVIVGLLFVLRVIGPAAFPAGAIVVPRDVPTLREALRDAPPDATIVLQ
ncbi:MAG: hypothetical protein WBC63_05440, partial [Candidatus Bipolaricaulia bacterium]